MFNQTMIELGDKALENVIGGANFTIIKNKNIALVVMFNYLLAGGSTVTVTIVQSPPST